MAGTTTHPITYSAKARNVSPLDWNAAWAWATFISGTDITLAGSVIWIDNEKALFGTGSDASVYYDGTNLIINPKEVGTGYISVLGGLKTAGNRISGITTVDDTYTILVTDETIICNKGTAFTVTLPTAVTGQKFTIKNIGAGTVTIDGAGADTIDGETTQTLIQWESAQVQCYAANSWGVL